jgi:hypothetical protein
MRGKQLVLDFTCVDNLALSRLANGTSSADSKYSRLYGSFIFKAVGIETLGGWVPEGLSFIKEIGKRLSLSSGDPRSTAFLMQQISLAVQRDNAPSILASLPRFREENIFSDTLKIYCTRVFLFKH